jgi:predicted Rossmann-fold nucleotide-binding protein
MSAYYMDDVIIVHGAARGADSLAALWALERGVHAAAVPARWETYDKSAGRLRNSAMLALRPDMVIAFPGGIGTADMKRRARQAGIAVHEIN